MEFANKVSLNHHIEAVHHDLRHPCSECDYQATSVRSLKEHVVTKHEGIRHECLECGKQFIRQSALKRHFQTVHEGKKNNEYNQCDFKTASGVSLKNHVNAIHE